VQVGEGALDHPAHAPEPGAVLARAAADEWPDPAPAQEAAELVVVVAALGGGGSPEGGGRGSASSPSIGPRLAVSGTMQNGVRIGDGKVVGNR
jgi:hypothetical protein